MLFMVGQTGVSTKTFHELLDHNHPYTQFALLGGVKGFERHHFLLP